MAFRTIRFGTKYQPSKKQIFGGDGPSTSAFAMSSLWGSSTFEMCDSDIVKKFPSVTVVDSCTSDKSALLHWQTELGITGFRKYSAARAAAGTRFHAKVEDILKNKAKNGIPSLDNLLSESPTDIHGFIQSVYGFLIALPDSVDPMVLEGRVVNHSLYYTGRFDAVLNLSEGPCLIDWKTVNERSSVSMNISKGDGLKGLFNYPKQLAAYVGAFNNDLAFKDMAKVKRGMIVLSYDTGSEATVIDMKAGDLEAYWKDYVEDMRKFWSAIENGKENFICNK